MKRIPSPYIMPHKAARLHGPSGPDSGGKGDLNQGRADFWRNPVHMATSNGGKGAEKGRSIITPVGAAVAPGRNGRTSLTPRGDISASSTGALPAQLRASEKGRDLGKGGAKASPSTPPQGRDAVPCRRPPPMPLQRPRDPPPPPPRAKVARVNPRPIGAAQNEGTCTTATPSKAPPCMAPRPQRTSVLARNDGSNPRVRCAEGTGPFSTDQSTWGNYCDSYGGTDTSQASSALADWDRSQTERVGSGSRPPPGKSEYDTSANNLSNLLRAPQGGLSRHPPSGGVGLAGSAVDKQPSSTTPSGVRSTGVGEKQRGSSAPLGVRSVGAGENVTASNVPRFEHVVTPLRGVVSPGQSHESETASSPLPNAATGQVGANVVSVSAADLERRIAEAVNDATERAEARVREHEKAAQNAREQAEVKVRVHETAAQNAREEAAVKVREYETAAQNARDQAEVKVREYETAAQNAREQAEVRLREYETAMRCAADGAEARVREHEMARRLAEETCAAAAQNVHLQQQLVERLQQQIRAQERTPQEIEMEKKRLEEEYEKRVGDWEEERKRVMESHVQLLSDKQRLETETCSLLNDKNKLERELSASARKYEQLEQCMNKRTAHVSELENELSLIRAERDILKPEEGRNEKLIQTHKEKIKQLESELQAESARLERFHDDTARSLNEKVAEMTQMRREFDELRRHAEALGNANAALEFSLQQVKNENVELVDEIERYEHYEEEKEIFRSVCKELHEKLQLFKDEYNRLKDEVERISGTSSTTVADYTDELIEAKLAQGQLEAKLAQLRERHDANMATMNEELKKQKREHKQNIKERQVEANKILKPLEDKERGLRSALAIALRKADKVEKERDAAINAARGAPRSVPSAEAILKCVKHLLPRLGEMQKEFESSQSTRETKMRLQALALAEYSAVLKTVKGYMKEGKIIESVFNKNKTVLEEALQPFVS